MFRVAVGFVAGIYIAQEHKNNVPDLTKVINGIKSDMQKKYEEYTKK